MALVTIPNSPPLANTNSHVTIDGCQTLHNLNPSALVET
jgi:hypothetical protein